MKADWIGDPLMFGAAAAIAFLVAGVIVAVDCWRQNSAEFMYSTYPVLRDPIGVLFCGILGLVATITFTFAQYAPDSWLGSMVTLKTDNTLARGALVGGSVMIIVRSKLLQLGSGGGDLGLEFFYLRGREAVLRRLRRRQANEKIRLIRDYLEIIMRSSDFTFGSYRVIC